MHLTLNVEIKTEHSGQAWKVGLGMVRDGNDS